LHDFIGSAADHQQGGDNVHYHIDVEHASNRIK
jgi:hypothetical protein